MNEDEVASAQAASLFGLALAGDERNYISQLQNLGNPELVVNCLVRMFTRTIDPKDHADFSRKLLGTVRAGASRY